MLSKLKYKLLNMFREFLVYHSSSLEFRAELMTLMMMSDCEIDECEEKLIKEMTSEIYGNDINRANILSEAIHEYHAKIIGVNGLEYNDLVSKIASDVRRTPRFVQKIDIILLSRFRDCLKDEDEQIFHDRVISFLQDLKDEYGEL